ncbi:enamine deaminase RidA (YjgF/YER057c/UK114 family) [Anaerobacterium chartisolvens]|uniref:Enamine deaminase RidA (YjgF/YER057c/UK114 family) n=1 Tax=Anaerobacterium chartisolvens TaxID=1297424 RepID=A0A369AGK7_9FIRM|nr:hypothetical protein [Anaerobacterium chartisolvens]RCX08490.1 enamine deaminase RidA (YjgF/YER057c/UK114 family) [Anaerobacterium chartisolvens]
MDKTTSLRIKEYDFGDHTRHYLTLALSSFTTMEEIEKGCRELYEYLKEKSIRIVFEKVFGKLEFKKNVKDIRKYLAEALKLELGPLSYLEGEPVCQAPVCSVTVYGISSDQGFVDFDYIHDKDNKIGTSYNILGTNYLHLYGLTCQDNEPKSTAQEYTSLFCRIQNCIVQRGFTPGDIVRTWIYMDEIYENYCNLNLARREFFEKNNIGYSDTSDALPASTCIGGKASNKSTAAIDVFCINKNGDYPEITRMYNRLQNEAEGKDYLFGPTFARAKSIDYGTHCEIQISGTASIDETGSTVFLNDPYNQIKKTFLNVEALLKQKGMDFGDVCVSTCFLKEREYDDIFNNVLTELGLCGLFDTVVMGDVCRSDLLFEFDGIAIKKKI